MFTVLCGFNLFKKANFLIRENLITEMFTHTVCTFDDLFL